MLGEQYSNGPGYPGRGPVYDLDAHRTADDRAVEALLRSVREPCAAQQLASGLGWEGMDADPNLRRAAATRSEPREYRPGS
jgi:hypothetical protein